MRGEFTLYPNPNIELFRLFASNLALGHLPSTLHITGFIQSKLITSPPSLSSHFLLPRSGDFQSNSSISDSMAFCLTLFHALRENKLGALVRLDEDWFALLIAHSEAERNSFVLSFFLSFLSRTHWSINWSIDFDWKVWCCLFYHHRHHYHGWVIWVIWQLRLLRTKRWIIAMQVITRNHCLQSIKRAYKLNVKSSFVIFAISQRNKTLWSLSLFNQFIDWLIGQWMKWLIACDYADLKEFDKQHWLMVTHICFCLWLIFSKLNLSSFV